MLCLGKNKSCQHLCTCLTSPAWLLLASSIMFIRSRPKISYAVTWNRNAFRKNNTSLAESYWDFIVIIVSSLVNKHETFGNWLWSGIKEKNSMKQKRGGETRQKGRSRFFIASECCNLFWKVWLFLLKSQTGLQKSETLLPGQNFALNRFWKQKLWNHGSFVSEFCTWY